MAPRTTPRFQVALATAGVVLFGVAAAVSAVPSCGGREATTDGDAAASPDASEPDEHLDAGAWDDDVISFYPEDAGPPDVQHGEAGPPPVIACGPDAGAPLDASACPPPVSSCLDPRWLVSYANGRCVGGVCAWDEIYSDCAVQFGGRCLTGAGDAGVCRQIVGK